MQRCTSKADSYRFPWRMDFVGATAAQVLLSGPPSVRPNESWELVQALHDLLSEDHARARLRHQRIGRTDAPRVDEADGRCTAGDDFPGGAVP
jgi:hypothetical protein